MYRAEPSIGSWFFFSFQWRLIIIYVRTANSITGLQLMYLLPGFGIAAILAYFVPELFVGIAYDAGGVASGPMTATFSLAFVQGAAAQVPSADLVTDGFGMIAIVAMMPIIAIELLGALYHFKMRKSAKARISKK